MPDTAPPITGEIEARLREILRDVLHSHGLKAEACWARKMESAPNADADRGYKVIHSALVAMSSAYAPDRASGDGVRMTDEIYEELLNESIRRNNSVAKDYDPALASQLLTAAKHIEQLQAALSAVSIPRSREVISGEVGKEFGAPPLPPAGGWRDMDSAPTDRPFFAIRGYEDHWTMMGAFQRRITPLEHDKNVWAVSCDKNYWLRADVWQNGTVELDLWRWSEIPLLPAPPASDKE